LIDVTRKYEFSASHRLHSDAFSEAENNALFGKCNNPFGHGHNYELFVTAQGPVDFRSGRAVDTAAMDKLIAEHVLAAYRYKNMNTDLPEFAATVPTTENVATAIAQRLKDHWSDAFPSGFPKLHKIRIRETDRNIFELIL